MESDRDISSVGTALQAAFVESMDFPSTALEEIILNLHQLHLVTQSEQRNIVEQLMGLSIFGGNFVSQQIVAHRKRLERKGLSIGSTSLERTRQLVGIAEDSGILRRHTIERMGKLRSIVEIAFLAGFACSDDIEVHTFLPAVKVFATLQGIIDDMYPFSQESSSHTDSYFYIESYLRGVMLLGYQVRKIITDVSIAQQVT